MQDRLVIGIRDMMSSCPTAAALVLNHVNMGVGAQKAMVTFRNEMVAVIVGDEDVSNVFESASVSAQCCG